ncbi:MAG: hypothetical protein LQ352_000939 [Teloschistes flavicans]|nr:MAG: hypothetical protein LQ352_000939 [Teloschistes flavicans]
MESRGTNIVININSNDGSTGRGVLIGLLSAFGSAAFVVLIFAVFYFFRHTNRGRIFLDRLGRPGEYDDEQAFAREETEALEEMDDLQRVEYLRAKAFVQANPPETMQTDISLSQFLAIQEKGVSAWEFEPELEIANCFVEGRTEIEFFDSECSVQSNLPIPKQNEVYYWESKLYDKPESTIVSIGVTTKPYPLFRLPGWHKSSLAYTSLGHRRYNQPFTPSPYGPGYVQGDVVGVGYRPRTGTVFFTRNGKKLDDVAHGLKTQNFFPTVGANGPCTVHVNFGQSGFVFIEANVKKWGLAPMTGSLAPPPPYGSEQGSILLEAGRDNTQMHTGAYHNIVHGRSRSGNIRFNPPHSPGPLRSPTEISLAQLAHIPSNEDIGEGTSRSAEFAVDNLAANARETDLSVDDEAQDYSVPPPEYSSPSASMDGRSRVDEQDDERRPLVQSEAASPPIPSYDAAVGDESARRSSGAANAPITLDLDTLSGNVQRAKYIRGITLQRPPNNSPPSCRRPPGTRSIIPVYWTGKCPLEDIGPEQSLSRQILHWPSARSLEDISADEHFLPLAATKGSGVGSGQKSSMKADDRSSAGAGTTLSASPAFQIIILGAGGGPNEDNVTGLLVRSTARAWTRDSVLAVDAGVHLAAIIKIFQEHLPQACTEKSSTAPSITIPPNGEIHSTTVETGKQKLYMTTGPFANLGLPHESAKANATYVFRNLISTYLITHPHLDHVAGFAINTAALQQTLRRKRIAALPSTIEAIKEHIFNGIIWPNLSDEGDGAVGFVSYDRLVDGGNVALGDGEGRGYIEVCDGLAVKGWSVSHGECMRHSQHGSYTSEPNDPGYSPYYSRRSSRKDISSGSMDSSRSQTFPQIPEKRAYDSAAYFLRDEHTGKEVLIFGDVEPDSVSLNPRTARVWQDAATKLAAGLLTGIIIECSYDNSQTDSMLFGHLTPRHLLAELRVLAGMVSDLVPNRIKASGSPRKRKRPSNGYKAPSDEQPSGSLPSRHHVRRRTRSSVSPSTPVPRASSRQSSMEMALVSDEVELKATTEENGGIHEVLSSRRQGANRQSSRPLEGLQVIIIHIKDALRDGPDISETILRQLTEHEAEAQLGCAFIISQCGTSVWL